MGVGEHDLGAQDQHSILLAEDQSMVDDPSRGSASIYSRSIQLSIHVTPIKI